MSTATTCGIQPPQMAALAEALLGRIPFRGGLSSATRRSSSEAVSRRSRLCDDRLRHVLRCDGVDGLLQRHLPCSGAPDSSFLQPVSPW